MSVAKSEDAVARRPLAAKLVAEVHELHARALELAAATGRMAGRRARRALREARHAEEDLLRVLGFDDYETFERYLDEHNGESAEGDHAASAPVAKLRVVHGSPDGATPDVEAMRSELEGVVRRVGQVEEELAEAQHAFARLSSAMQTLRPALDAELSAALRSAVEEFETLCATLRRERDCFQLEMSQGRRAAADERAVIIERAHDDALEIRRRAAIDALRRIVRGE